MPGKSAGREATGSEKFSSSSCHVKRTPNQGARARGSTTPARARSVRAGAGGPVAQGRAGKEGAGHRGESIKGVIQPALSSEAPRARPGRLEKKVAPGRGATNCCTSAVQDPGFLFIRYPFSSFSFPKPPPLLPSFVSFLGADNSPEREKRLSFCPSPPRLFPSPSFPSPGLFLPTPGDLSRWPPGRGLSA